MIETIHDVGECTSIEELQNQIDNYNQVIAEYKRENPIVLQSFSRCTTMRISLISWAYYQRLVHLGLASKNWRRQTND